MKPAVFTLEQIEGVLKNLDPVQAVEEGFVAYSEGRVTVPPVGELLFQSPPGDAHIKYGYIHGDEYYVIKIASGFYHNIKLGLPSFSGLMLLFTQATGQLAGILLDEGHLTNIRTAAAGAVAAKYLAPKRVNRIGVFGAGVQGRLQLRYLKPLLSCRQVMVWGINEAECLHYKAEMEKEGFSVQVCLNGEDIAAQCNFLVTATPAKQPLLKAAWIGKGTHITAMGSDTPEKCELEPALLAKADIVVGDSLQQCESRGEIFKAAAAGHFNIKDAVELGNVISGKAAARSSEEQITVADLTGVAVQDIQISKAVFDALTGSSQR